MSIPSNLINNFTGFPKMSDSYRKFSQMITGYRDFFVLEGAIKSGIIDILQNAPLSAESILQKVGLMADEGGRFLELLTSIGILEKDGGCYALSELSRKYLTKGGEHSQRAVIEFEPILIENWGRLVEVLQNGQTSIVEEKSTQESAVRLNLFQNAMTDAAKIRSVELWENLPPWKERGKIIDIGGGDGIYIRRFMEKYPLWNGVLCDLQSVCDRFLKSAPTEQIITYPVNVLDENEMELLVSNHGGCADLLLLSNLCHCYSQEENRLILKSARKLLADDGILVVHDFFKNNDDFGAMYDIHLMVNTYNGRCFSTVEMELLLREAGFSPYLQIALPSGSLALLCE